MDRQQGSVVSIGKKFLESLGEPFYVLFVSAVPPFLLFLITVLNLLRSTGQEGSGVVSLKKVSRKRTKRLKFISKSRVLYLTIGVLLVLAAAYTISLLRDLPSPSQLRNHQPKLTTHIYDRNGNELYKIYKDENRSLVSLAELSPFVGNATVAIEDKEFWTHPGFSIPGIFRALRHDLFSASSSNSSSPIQGGSTITQQLIKNTLLTPEKTLRRKIREIALAFLLERKFTKKEILEMYLNEVSYGGTVYGIQEAAQQYFGVDAKNLTLAQASLLAGLPAAPTINSPLGANPEFAFERQKEVLRRMTEDQYITEQESRRALGEKLVLRDGVTNIRAPHFVMFVRDSLVRQFGEDLVNSGGLKVTTTLDLPLQESAQHTVTEEVGKLQRLHVSNGAALVTNPQTGDILAMVGSVNYFDFEHDGQVNVTARPRQPGSSIKPVMYAAALQRGYTPASVILDEPITFNIPGSPPYTPINYDRMYHGAVPLRTALGSSYNIPAVKVLSTIGVDAMIDQAERMGIKTWANRSRFGLSLTLGGGEVTMEDMAEVYGTLANGGVHTGLNPILKIEDSSGNILYKKSSVLLAQSYAVPASVVYQLTSILSDPIARSPAFGTHSVLNIPDHQVAVKTGTTNSLRDNWAFGYTTDIVVATWVGNNDNTPMSYIASGITGASPIWAIIMKSVLAQRTSPHEFSKPGNTVVAVKICTMTGQLACDGCPSRDEFFVPGTEPKEACKSETIQELKQKQEEKNRDKILEGLATKR